MLDINFIRENKELIETGAKKKHLDFNVNELLKVVIVALEIKLIKNKLMNNIKSFFIVFLFLHLFLRKLKLLFLQSIMFVLFYPFFFNQSEEEILSLLLFYIQDKAFELNVGQ
jgi:hypothetical protein